MIKMEKKSKKQYSWYPEGGNYPCFFGSKKDAMRDAQQKYDEQREEFEYPEDVSPVIKLGIVKFFDMEKAVKQIVEGIEDDIGDQLYDFAGDCDFDIECSVSKQDKKIFTKEAVQALLPIVKKYVFINPEWLCTITKKYDLKNKKWIEL
jgi:hypothetical protein